MERVRRASGGTTATRPGGLSDLGRCFSSGRALDVVVLNWLPLISFVAAAVLVIGHPTLALRLFWKALGVLPGAFGSYVDYLISSPPLPPSPVTMGHVLEELPSVDPTLHGSVAASPALTGRCAPESESFWRTAVMLLIAGEGEAASGFVAAMRGLFAGQAA